MEDIIEENVITEVINFEDQQHPEKPPSVSISGTNSFFLHCLFFLIGVCHYIPITFLAAANNFWLYKLKDPSNTDNSAEDRNYMQVNFASATQICNTVFSFAFGVFNMTVAHRFSILSRIFLTLFINLTIFVFFTISVKIDTDNFQLTYFVLVLLAAASLSGSNTVNIVASLGLYPRFPLKYMNTSLVGEGCLGILGDLLNIVALSVFNNDITKATLLYFLLACGFLAATLLLFFIMKRQTFFQQCLASVTEMDKNSIPTFKEIKSGLWMIWFPCIVNAYFLLSEVLTHTAVTSLVVSEQNGDQTTWAVTYFSPVMTFLLSNICLLIGRSIVSYVPGVDRTPKPLFYTLAALRFATVVPFIWLCNAQPRHNLPVLFPHDYQYGIILGVFMITNGIIINWPRILIARTIKKEDAYMAYNIFSFSVNVVQTTLSPLGLVVANIL